MEILKQDPHHHSTKSFVYITKNNKQMKNIKVLTNFYFKNKTNVVKLICVILILVLQKSNSMNIFAI